MKQIIVALSEEEEGVRLCSPPAYVSPRPDCALVSVLGRRFGASLPAFLHSLDYFSKVVSWKLSAGEEGEPRQDSQSTPTKSWPNCVPDIAP